MSARGKAEELLTFYMKAAWERAGLSWHSDNDREVSEIVDALQDMVRDEIRMHAEGAPHIYPDGSTS